jgi:hypothetical protein
MLSILRHLCFGIMGFIASSGTVIVSRRVRRDGGGVFEISMRKAASHFVQPRLVLRRRCGFKHATNGSDAPWRLEIMGYFVNPN